MSYFQYTLNTGFHIAGSNVNADIIQRKVNTENGLEVLLEIIGIEGFSSVKLKDGDKAVILKSGLVLGIDDKSGSDPQLYLKAKGSYTLTPKKY